MGKLDPDRVRFTGPLAPCAAGLRGEFASLGYARTSAALQLQCAAHLSRWLDAAGLGLGDLRDPVIDQFLGDRRRTYTSHYSRRGFAPILRYLRVQGLAPEAEPVVGPGSDVEVLLARFTQYLLGERALSAPVATAYCHWVRPFASEVLFAGGASRVGELAAGDVSVFLAARLPAMSRKSAQMTACALRSFLRFLHVQGLVRAPLAGVVPPVASWKLAGLPRGLTSDQVEALIGACDRSRAAGRRDVAVITVLRRLGLRSGEVAALRLADIDWRAGTVTIAGKGGRTDRLPLPGDVAGVVLDYLRNARPNTASRTVFVRAVAPFTSLGSSSVSCIVGRAAKRAGLGTVHAHRLRHTAATQTLNAGASLEEVAQLMRHASVTTTAIYAKTDQTRLAQIARPWPGTGGLR
jgi:integrase/recombinase XerD